jgi:CheY-like chemotaxis protein
MMNNKQILLVEDNPFDRKLLLRALKREQFADLICLANDGVEALELLNEAIAKGSDLPCMILLDLKMPRMNGLEFLEHIKGNKLTCTIPVIVLTTSAQSSDLKKAYQLGVNSYLIKPFDYDEFATTIVQVTNYWLNMNRIPAKLSVTTC